LEIKHRGRKRQRQRDEGEHEFDLRMIFAGRHLPPRNRIYGRAATVAEKLDANGGGAADQLRPYIA
jgi:hypothetical protein